MKEDSVSGVFLKEKAQLIEKINQFTDIRKNPQIKLNHIILSLLLMPFYSITSLLGLDRLSRKKQFKTLFGCTRKMVASDSTVNRAMRWLDENESEQFQRSFLDLFEQQHLSRIQLQPGGKYRRIGIVDGSQMGTHHPVVLCLSGKTDYPVMVMDGRKRGKELPTARALLNQGAEVLKGSFPDLFLFDSLYFNSKTFKQVVGDFKAHLLIKSDEPKFRDVLSDAKFLFDHKDELIDVQITETHGFDYQRMCSWSMEITSGEFAGFPIQIAHLVEDYPKRLYNQHTDCWIVTTDLSLSDKEIREAAHLRWHIENNAFKRLSHHTGTKRFYFKDPKPFFTMLKLLCAAIALLGILLQILKQNTRLCKRILAGIKPTWKNIFSQMEEILQPGVFC